MNSVRPRRCQTSWLAIFLLGLWTAGAAPSPVPTPTPPPWQAELTTARAVQASFLLTPAKSNAEDEAREAKLAAAYRQLALKYADVPAVQLAVGDGLAELETPEAAAPFWLRAAALDPQNAEAADALGGFYLHSDRIPEARAQFQRAVDLRPDVASYHSSLANVLYVFRKRLVAPPALPDDQAVLRLALEHFRRAAELSPGNLPLAKAYAETFYVFREPDWPQALAAWQTVLALSGEDRDFANSHLARVSVKMGRQADAETYLWSIRSPAYDRLKSKLLKPSPAASPSPAKP